MTVRNRLLTTLLTFATAATAVPTIACPPGGHGGHGYRRPSPVYHRPAYRPVYTTPVYTTPVTTVQQAQATATQTTAAAQLRAKAAQAKAAFLAKNYGTALSLLDQVVKAAPKNNEALQFRSLVHFAMGDYKAAAADAYEAMKYGPVWDKKSLDGLYGDMAVYERHLKALRAAAAEEPETLHLHFLLAYQALLSGDLAEGEKELETVLAIKPAEPLAEAFLKVVKDLRAKEATVAADGP